MCKELAQRKRNSARLDPGSDHHRRSPALGLIIWFLSVFLQAGERSTGDGSSVPPDPQLAACHDVLSEFFQRHEVPGAAVAITDQTRADRRLARMDDFFANLGDIRMNG